MAMDQKEVRQYLAFSLGALDAKYLTREECNEFLDMIRLTKVCIQGRLVDIGANQGMKTPTNSI